MTTIEERLARARDELRSIQFELWTSGPVTAAQWALDRALESLGVSERACTDASEWLEEAMRARGRLW